MPIVTVRMTQDEIDRMDRAIADKLCKDRSELIRAAIRDYIIKLRMEADMLGK